MNDERLIEEPARAMLMTTQAGVSEEYAWPVQFDEVREELLKQARAAFVVFEKAHARTDRRACDVSERLARDTDAEIEAAARVMFEPPSIATDKPEYTWAEMVREGPSRADIWRSDSRAALRAAFEVKGEGR